MEWPRKKYVQPQKGVQFTPLLLNSCPPSPLRWTSLELPIPLPPTYHSQYFSISLHNIYHISLMFITFYKFQLSNVLVILNIFTLFKIMNILFPYTAFLFYMLHIKFGSACFLCIKLQISNLCSLLLWRRINISVFQKDYQRRYVKVCEEIQTPLIIFERNTKFSLRTS